MLSDKDAIATVAVKNLETAKTFYSSWLIVESRARPAIGGLLSLAR